MKKLLLLLLLCPFFSSFSQTYTQGVDEKLQLLDKSGIATNVLYDRVYPGAGLTAFNQSAADTSDVRHFYRAWAELQTADYLARWNPPEDLQAGAQAELTQNKIPIGLINADFNHLDELAFQDNLVAVQGADSLLTDVPGRPRSPWLAKTALVISPLAVHSSSASVTLVTGPAFVMEAAAAAVTAIEIDIDNGQGWQPLPLAGELGLDFAAPGLHYLHFKVSLAGGETRYTRAALKVYTAPPVLPKSELQQKVAESDCFSGTIEASRSFQGYDESQPYSGTGEYQVFLGGPELDHPVIVLDGFDPFEGQGDLGNDIEGIYNFLNYNTFDNVGDDLTNLGYDIIPLNFTAYVADLADPIFPRVINGGTDFIERSAMTLIDLIEQVNSCKTGNNPIKIIGFSMGGLVARYALRYMELNGIPHDTDLFVSVDVPHKGAIVPTGIQELADLADDIAPLGLGNKADDLLHVPAAKQMLIHHYLAGSQTPQGAAWHSQFYTELEAMGFPQQTRNIAIVNGSADGVPVNTPGQQYIDAHGEAGALIALGTKASAKLHYAPARGVTKNVLKFKLKLRLLFIDIVVYTRTRQVFTPAAVGSYENSPGGYFDVGGLTRDFLGDSGQLIYDKGTLATYYLNAHLSLATPAFSFVPVKSALAYSGEEQDLYEDFSARDLVCTLETPFDTYYLPGENQRHTALTAESAGFILQEILGNPQAPNLNVEGDNIITGPSVVCNADTVFSLRDCSVDDVNWSVSSNLQIVNVSPNAITVRAVDNATKGPGSISAVFAGQQAMEKAVWVGKPQAPAGSISGPQTVVTGALVNYQGATAAGATSYKWYLPHPYDVVAHYDYAGPNWQMKPTDHTSLQAFTGTGQHAGYVQLMGENACGCGGAQQLYVSHAGAGGGSGGSGGGLKDLPGGGIPKFLPSGTDDGMEAKETDLLLLYPNPAAKKITVKLAGSVPGQAGASAAIYGVYVFDIRSRKAAAVFTAKEGSQTAEIDISHLAPGHYTVMIQTATGNIIKKLMVK